MDALAFAHSDHTRTLVAIDFMCLARATPQFSGADVDGAIEAAKERVVGEILDGAPERPIDEPDLWPAARHIQPSAFD